VIKKEDENILKYKTFIIEIQHMWNVKAKVAPLTGTISKSFRQYLYNRPRRHEINELQKTATLGTALTSESANVKVHNIFHVHSNITCSTNCKYTTAASLYTLEA